MRARLRGALCFLAALAVAAALPAATAAHEVVLLKDGTLTVLGDQAGKPADRVTVDYDPVKDEYLIGHDITNPIPDECYRDAVEPFHILHCPASLVSEIDIDTGSAGDKVIFGPAFGGPNLSATASGITPDLTAVVSTGGGNDSFTGGAEVDHLNTGGGSDKATLGAGNDVANMGGGSDKASGGSGNDEIKGGGGSDKLKGNGGADSLFGGGGSDKLLAGAGNDKCVPGPGAGKQSSC